MVKDLFKKISKGISNFDIEKIFLDVFPSDKINKLIMFEKMMLGKNTRS